MIDRNFGSDDKDPPAPAPFSHFGFGPHGYGLNRCKTRGVNIGQENEISDPANVENAAPEAAQEPAEEPAAAQGLVTDGEEMMPLPSFLVFTDKPTSRIR